jgi:hypothetical protein
MADDPTERSTNKPMFGERRPLWPGVLGVVGLIVVVLVVFLLITYLG